MTGTTSGYQRFFAELKRRHVFRVMAVYGAVAFVVLQVADILQEGLNLPESFLPVATAVLLLGFPIAIVLAWAFESTPEGIKRTEDAAPGELRAIATAPASQRWPAGVLALVGVVALLAGTWYVGRQSAPAAAADATETVEASIAVLPFVNMSSDQEQEYFSDGISEELLNLLAKIPELRVAARTSSFSFKGQNVEIPEIADRLNVAHVLEGSVRKSGDEVRITAQLIRADDGFHLWSETWDRTLEDIFAIQDEIASDVADQLKVTLLGEVPTVDDLVNPEAYALFLQGRHLGRQITVEGWERSNALYEQALAIDAEYAAPWSGLANNYFRQTSNGLRPTGEGYRLAREAANRALALDPEHAEAYVALSGIANVSENDLASSARFAERAFELDPTNPDIIGGASIVERDLGRFDRALTLRKHVLARDPVNAGSHGALGIMYLYAGRFDEAIESAQTALNLSPGRIAAYYNIGSALLMKGEYEEALAAFALEEADEEYRVKGMALANWELGFEAEFEAGFAELRERWGERWPSEIAHVYAWTGDADAAFEWLDRAVEQNEDGLFGQFNRLWLAPIHDDPRWDEFREATGTSPEQLAAIEFDVKLPE